MYICARKYVEFSGGFFLQFMMKEKGNIVCVCVCFGGGGGGGGQM